MTIECFWQVVKRTEPLHISSCFGNAIFRGDNMFKPKRMLFEKVALEYPLGEKAYDWAKANKVEVEMFSNTVRYKADTKLSMRGQYVQAKATLAITVKKSFKFQTCKPSAHYQLPLVTGCPGLCEYCYLLTNLGKQPYLRVYANQNDIRAQVEKYMAEKEGLTIFEGAATSDPLPLEHITGILSDTIRYFAGQELGRFKFVTKFTDVEPLLDLNHNGHTFVRFSLNAEEIIRQYEKATPTATERIQAAARIAEAGYPIGFIIAPIFLFEGWREDYKSLFIKLGKAMENVAELPIEMITHRFTSRAKQNIAEIFPDTTLPMNEEERRFKFGQFGYGKYVYKEEDFKELKGFFSQLLEQYIPQAKMSYFV